MDMPLYGMLAFGLVVGAGVAVLVMRGLQSERVERHYLSGYRRGQRDAANRQAAVRQAALEARPSVQRNVTSDAVGNAPARVTHARVVQPRHRRR